MSMQTRSRAQHPGGHRTAQSLILVTALLGLIARPAATQPTCDPELAPDGPPPVVTPNLELTLESQFEGQGVRATVTSDQAEGCAIVFIASETSTPKNSPFGSVVLDGLVSDLLSLPLDGQGDGTIMGAIPAGMPGFNASFQVVVVGAGVCVLSPDDGVITNASSLAHGLTDSGFSGTGVVNDYGGCYEIEVLGEKGTVVELFLAEVDDEGLTVSSTLISSEVIGPTERLKTSGKALFAHPLELQVWCAGELLFVLHC